MDQETPICADDCPRLKWVFRLLVFAQVMLFALLMLTSQSTNHQWTVWLLKIAGIVVGLWAIATMGRHVNISPELKENAPLRTTGPYRFVRHPMYLALLVFCGGYVIGNVTAYGLALWLSLLLVIGLKIYYEERILHRRFPGYESYAQKTKRLIPFIF